MPPLLAIPQTGRSYLHILPFLLIFSLPLQAQIDSRLLGALKNCDMAALQRCEEEVANINAVDAHGANALMWAVYYCDLPVVKELVHHGARACDSATIQVSSGWYGSLQAVTASKGKLDILQYLADSLQLSLYEEDYDPFLKKQKGWTPLSYAACNGHLNMVEYLLKKGVLIHLINKDEITLALMKAVKYKHWNIFKLLMPEVMKMDAKSRLGEQATYLMNKAAMLEEQDSSRQDLSKEVLLQQFVLELAKTGLGEEQLEYINELYGLASSYFETGRYEQALPPALQAVQLSHKVLGDEHPVHIYSVGMLALLYTQLGIYDKALSLYTEDLALAKKIWGEGHPDCAIIQDRLAYLYYYYLGRYEKAIPLLQQALVTKKREFGEKHASYASSIHNLAMVYRTIGQYEKALPLLQQALAVSKEVLGEKNAGYPPYLNSLSVVLMEMGRYAQALPLLQQAVSITGELVGPEHIDYATSLNNLASLYKETGQYEKAIPLLEQTMAITKKTLGEEHLNYAGCTAGMAALYSAMGEYEKALPLFEQALAIIRKVQGAEHPDYAKLLYEIGSLHDAQGNHAKAAAFFMQANSIVLEHLHYFYTFVSEQEKLSLLNKSLRPFSYIPSLLWNRNLEEPAVLNQLYTSELTLKGMVLQDQQRVLRSIHQNGDSNAIKLYEQWQAGKRMIGQQLLLSINNQLPFLDSLQEATNQLEQQLSRSAAGLRKVQSSQLINSRDVSRKLLKTQAAIEFICFRLCNKKWTDSTLYAALVLLPADSVCKFVPLCEEKQLKRLVDRPGAVRTAGALNDSLYNLVWKPLERYLRNIHTVYFAPAGLLHRIAFQSLHVGTGQLLIDKYHLHQMLSTRSLAMPAGSPVKPALAAVWGNIDYGRPATGLLAGRGQQEDDARDIASSFDFYNADTRGMRTRGWPSLPGTKKEINSVGNLLRHAGMVIQADSGAVATEETFKALDGKSPRILHLATHGFFLPLDDTMHAQTGCSGRSSFTAQKNPLFRSGLILAGGNRTWKGEPTPPGKEDGILTAYEIAQMDLSNTDLVVLSACETALGDLQSNEGVFGLQRAFKMAGVKQLIVSLWKVPDRETTELMTMFYRNWLAGQSTREALRQAQLRMKKKYPPEKWAAFVLVE